MRPDVGQISTTPITIPKTTRADEIRWLTSARAGKIIPHGFIPILREDAVSRGSITLHFAMEETVRPLLNSIKVRAKAVFVPYTAFERFGGSIDRLNKSYQGVKDRDTDAAPIPFVNRIAFGGAAPIWKTMGVHWPEGALINATPIEAYNLYVNWERKRRSKVLPMLSQFQGQLAQAFWDHPGTFHIKPDFDQAMMDGEVALAVNTTVMPLLGSAKIAPVGSGGVGAAVGGTPIDISTAYVELQAQGLKLSLSNIELGKQIVAWAKTREKYKGIDAEHLKDLLMEAIRIPDEAAKQPMVLATAQSIFGYTERKAMDGASLDKSVTTGRTSVTLNFWTPPLNTGGVILIVSEIVPEQMFERMEDAYLGISNPNQFPNAQNDFLDPEKVDVVKNRYLDVLHASPDKTFGYAPLNHQWKRSLFRAGGRFRRVVGDPFVEDRQRIWSVETPNPRLNSAFYLVPADLPHSVFADTTADPFEIVCTGAVQITGNTQFGATFEEHDGDYDHIADQVDDSRLVVPVVAPGTNPGQEPGE